MRVLQLSPHFLFSAGVKPVLANACAPISSVLLVGAEFSRRDPTGTEQDLGDHDRTYLRGFFNVCARHGVAVAKTPTVQVINIASKTGGDYLDPAETYKADAVLFCYLFYRASLESIVLDDTHYHKTSPHAVRKEAWVQALRRSNASIVGNVRNTVHEHIKVNKWPQATHASLRAANQFLGLPPTEPPLDMLLQGTEYTFLSAKPLHVEGALSKRELQFFKRSVG